MNTGNGVLVAAFAGLVLLALTLVLVGQELKIRALQTQVGQSEGAR